jgi:hypothetical protein
MITPEPPKTKITKIVITLSTGEDLILSISDAKEVLKQLQELFGENKPLLPQFVNFPAGVRAVDAVKWVVPSEFIAEQDKIRM